MKRLLIVLISWMPFLSMATPIKSPRVLICTPEDGSSCTIAHCKIQKLSKLSKTYSIKPTNFQFKVPMSGNGHLYLKARLETEALSLPNDSGSTQIELTDSNLDLDVTGDAGLRQVVSRLEGDKLMVVALEPFYSKSEKKKFDAKLMMITNDIYLKGSPVKIEATITCTYR